MIAALVNLTPGVGRTMLAVNLAGELALQGRRVVVLDVDGVSGTGDWIARRRANALPALFDSATIAGTQLRHGLGGFAASFDHVVIDTPSRSPAALRAVLPAAETALIPIQADRTSLGRCAATMQLVIEALAMEPAPTASLVLSKVPDGLWVKPGSEATVLGLRLPVSAAVIRHRQAFADSMDTGLLVPELEMAGQAEADIRHLVSETFGLATAPVAD
ncbi:chromosome partitioning protein [Azospirillum oryzae]|uniref:Chromosome partitioning protein n=1 Tax=Azospirillum oryzae TaxID=286727 RepID=A0A1X7GJP9_9PROT|nr:chromosome partitioning protein [Azospirillum oryzae]SMF70829.1 chromosome partitioning protein [Azospirillum oryzae]